MTGHRRCRGSTPHRQALGLNGIERVVRPPAVVAVRPQRRRGSRRGPPRRSVIPGFFIAARRTFNRATAPNATRAAVRLVPHRAQVSPPPTDRQSTRWEQRPVRRRRQPPPVPRAVRVHSARLRPEAADAEAPAYVSIRQCTPFRLDRFPATIAGLSELRRLVQVQPH
jgi:hypothetical protein